MPLDSRISGGVGGAGQGAAIGMSIGGPWGAAIGGVAGGILGALGGGGEDEAKKLAQKQADIIRRTALENERRARLELGQVSGAARAAVGASNILMSGSSERYVTQLESQFRQDMAWEKGKSWMNEQLAKDGGQVAADQIRYSSMSSALQGFGAAAGSGVFGTYSKSSGYIPPWG